ncbi:MAG: type II toxin-antitoxin system VapC family toxin, partial [Pseudomonadota bacterium]
MAAKVYIETSIVSYLTARPSRDVVIAGRQQVTQDWWDNRRETFDLVMSQFVVDEASAGDAVYAQRRLEALQGIPLIAVNSDAQQLAMRFVQGGPLPPKAALD